VPHPVDINCDAPKHCYWQQIMRSYMITLLDLAAWSH